MTKSTTALPRSPWSVGPSAWSVPSGAPPRACEGWGGGGPSPSGGGQRGPSSATARDGGEGVGHRIHDRRAERHEDGQHQGRRHHRDHDPARDVAPLGILAAHPRREGPPPRGAPPPPPRAGGPASPAVRSNPRIVVLSSCLTAPARRC